MIFGAAKIEVKTQLMISIAKFVLKLCLHRQSANSPSEPLLAAPALPYLYLTSEEIDVQKSPVYNVVGARRDSRRRIPVCAARHNPTNAYTHLPGCFASHCRQSQRSVVADDTRRKDRPDDAGRKEQY